MPEVSSRHDAMAHGAMMAFASFTGGLNGGLLSGCTLSR